ncbi:MAG: hypothetical protein DRO39_03850 [Thermoprotei archaeon]|nr:MAG: hypothetical protein DRO39_03850 [Thermoprotei archaeon]
MPAGIGLLLALLMLPGLTAASVELVWESDNAKISVTVHRYRPSSTSGWATEEFATLDHEAGHSLGHIMAWIDHSCNIEGFVSAKDGSLDVASIIHQQYGKWFRGVRIAEVSVESPDFNATFSAHTFTMNTHLDNTWTLDAWLSAEGSDMSVYALRLYQHFKTHGTPDESDDDMDSQYYALIDAVLGDGEAFAGSGWFPDKRNSVWWGNETLAFQFTGDDISAYIESVDFPIISIYMDVDELIGEVVRPR